MAKLQEVIKLFEDEIVDAERGVDSWTDNRSKCNNINAIFSDSDCRDMQQYYKHKKNLTKEYLELVKSITEL